MIARGSAVGVARAHGKSIKNRRHRCTSAKNNVVTIFGEVGGRSVIAKKVTRKNGDVRFPIALREACLGAGKSAVDGNSGLHGEACCAQASC